MTHKRYIDDLLKARLSEENPLIQVVIGPRQIGKTTAIKSFLSSSGDYHSADSPTPLRFEEIQNWWSQALTKKKPLLAIDEVQKIQGWSEVIKKLWDGAIIKPKLILSGSAALTIEKNLKETLAGRFELIRANHWTFLEAQNIFKMNLKEYIEFGCYPGSERFRKDLDRWGEYVRDSIVEPAIGRDIMQLHPVENPALFRQVFLLATQLPAQIVSLNKLQAQLQDRGAMATIQHYLNLLNAGFLITGVQKFSESGFRAKASPPKVIVHDNALLRAFERPISKKLTPSQFGHYFENSVGARFLEAGWNVSYWKDRSLEVYFIVNGPSGEKWSIEVKSAKVTKNELKGLSEFCKRNPDYEPCLISFVDQKMDGIKSLSCKSILSLDSNRISHGL